MPLTKDMPASTWIHDFVKSDNPKFRGKSKEERRKMALGAYYGAQKEEVITEKRYVYPICGNCGGETSPEDTKAKQHRCTPSKMHKCTIMYKDEDGNIFDKPGKGHTLKEAIEKPNSSGQGHDPDHVKNPYHDIITKHGYTYSHSTPVTHLGGEKVMHHTYKGGKFSPNGHYDDHHNVSVHGNTWETSRGSATGRSYFGRDAESLDKHLKSKRSRYAELREGMENILESHFIVHYKVGEKDKQKKMMRVVKAETEEQARKAHHEAMGKEVHQVSHVSRLQEDILDLINEYPSYFELKEALIRFGVSEGVDDLIEQIGEFAQSVIQESANEPEVKEIAEESIVESELVVRGGSNGFEIINKANGKVVSRASSFAKAQILKKNLSRSVQEQNITEGLTGPTRMQLQNTYDSAKHLPTEYQRVRHVEKSHGIRNVKIVNGQVVSFGHKNGAFGEMPRVRKEEVEPLEEGRPSQRHPLEGHVNHSKTSAELRYIQQDAGEAAKAMRGHDPKAEGKYEDQVHDAGTVLHFRRQHNATEVHQMPAWYQKKYGPKPKSTNEEFLEENTLHSILTKHGYKQGKSEAEMVHPEGHQVFSHDFHNPEASWSHYAGNRSSSQHRYLPPPYPGKKGSKGSMQKIGYGHKELTSLMKDLHEEIISEDVVKKEKEVAKHFGYKKDPNESSDNGPDGVTHYRHPKTGHTMYINHDSGFWSHSAPSHPKFSNSFGDTHSDLKKHLKKIHEDVEELDEKSGIQGKPGNKKRMSELLFAIRAKKKGGLAKN